MGKFRFSAVTNIGLFRNDDWPGERIHVLGNVFLSLSIATSGRFSASREVAQKCPFARLTSVSNATSTA